MPATQGIMFIGTYNNIDVTMCESYLEKWFKEARALFVTG